MREIAVFGTAHPVLPAGLRAGPGVRCAATQASSAAAWPGCPVAAPDSAHPSTMSPDELGQRREDAEGQPAARGGGVQRLVPGPEPGAAAAQPGHDGDQVLQGPGQQVQARDDEGAAGAEALRAGTELPEAAAALLGRRCWFHQPFGALRRLLLNGALGWEAPHCRQAPCPRDVCGGSRVLIAADGAAYCLLGTGPVTGEGQDLG